MSITICRSGQPYIKCDPIIVDRYNY